MEFGYTPKNLQLFLQYNNISRKDAWMHLDKHRSTFENYLRNVDHPKFSTMPHAVWLKLLEMGEIPPQG